MKMLYKIMFTSVAVMMAVMLRAQTIVYVNEGASGANNGTSWTNAYTSLQAGIDAAALSTPSQVWVKAGTYYPTTGTDRTVSFVMKNGVEIYGGFSGIETLLTQRDRITNATILSGDIGTSGVKTDNSNNVINNDYLSTSPLTASAILDGVIVEDGYGSLNPMGGAGLRNMNASPIIRNCTFRNNEIIGSAGGAIHNTEESNPIILSCVFKGNVSGSWGGAIAYRTATNFSYVNNVASTIANCLFYDNTSGSVGGAIYVINYLVDIINNTITENTSNNSGGAAIFYGVINGVTGLDDAAYTNNIVWGNTANNSGQGQEQIRLNNSGPVFTSNIVEGGLPGVSVLNIDPVFTNAPNDDFSISYCDSPAIDIGSSSNLPAFLTTDLMGNNRVFGSSIDLGAYEVQSLRPSFSTNNVTHVNCFGESSGQVTLNATGTHGPLTFSMNGANYTSNNVFTSLTAGSYTAYVKDNNGCIVTEPITINQPAQLGVTVNVTDVLCFGEAQGVIAGEFGGGTPPWRISFDGGSSFATPQLTGSYSITGLLAGTYNLTIVDANSCSFTVAAPAVIASPTEIVATVTKSDITCNGAADGTIAINATGGTGILQYSIDGSTFQTSNSFSGLMAGNYSIKVKDANNCEVTVGTETIIEPTLLSTSVSKTDLICSGSQAGEIEIVALGGTTPLEYAIDGSSFQTTPTFSGLSGGAYSVTTKDANGCTVVDNVVLMEPDLFISGLSKEDISCHGANDGSITLSPSGGTSPLTFSLDNSSFGTTTNFTNLDPGNYTITTKDGNSCLYEEMVTIVDPDQLTLSAQFDGTSVTVTPSGGTAPFNYSVDGTAYQPDNIFLLPNGQYTFMVRDANDCEASTTQSLVITALEHGLEDVSIRAYPNPTTSAVTLSGISGKVDIRLLDVTGRVVVEKKQIGSNMEIPVYFLKPGYYLLDVITDNGKRTTFRLMKK